MDPFISAKFPARPDIPPELSPASLSLDQKNSIVFTDNQGRQWTIVKYADQIWRITVTIARIIHGLCYRDRIAAYIPNQENIPEDSLPTVSFVINKEGYQLNNGHIMSFIDYLIGKYPNQKFDAIKETTSFKPDVHPPSYYVEMKLEEYEAQHSRPDMLFVPIVFSHHFVGMEISHVVLLEINFKNQTLYYYDSQALKCSDPYRNVYDNCNISEDIALIKKLCFPNNSKVTLKENNNPHQEDVHSCGVYCCDYMERRITGESFEQIESKGKTSQEIEMARILIGVKLASAIIEAPQEQPQATAQPHSCNIISKDDF